MKWLGVRHVIGVNPEGAQADSAKFLVADGDGIGRAPMLIRLHPRGEEIYVGLKRRLEGLIPVLQVGKDGKLVRRELIKTGSELIGNLAFIHKQRQLRVTHGKLAAVLYLTVLHVIAIGQDPAFWLDPINDINKLLADK